MSVPLTRRIIAWGSAASALGALVSLYLMLGLPRPAWTTDIRRLSLGQAQNAVTIYQNEVHNLLSVQPPTDPIARQNWLDQLNQAKHNRTAAQQRLLDLSR